VVSACLSCLGSVVNNVTKNFKLIRDCFRRYFKVILSFKKHHEMDPRFDTSPRKLPFAQNLYWEQIRIPRIWIYTRVSSEIKS
jgi:hypothetical protein